MDAQPQGRKLPMAQYGTEHAHAAGVLAVLLQHDRVDFRGVYEPDESRRHKLMTSGRRPWSDVGTWFATAEEMLDNPTIGAVAAEGLNRVSLGQARQIVEAGKHLLLDKPAGDDYLEFERIARCATDRGILVQLGYMFRRHDGFERISQLVRDGTLGKVYAIRAHMSGNLTPEAMQTIGRDHRGGVLYDLGGHMVDQIVWLLGRPDRATSYIQRTVSGVEGFADNTLAVLEYPDAIAYVDIAAMEPPPLARRFEVYGTEGSAILEPFEPATLLRLALRSARDDYPSGLTYLELEARPRYVASIGSFVRAVLGEAPPDRTIEHELVVQETFLRIAGAVVPAVDSSTEPS